MKLNAEGVDVTGADTYTSIFRTEQSCSRLRVTLDAGYDALLSLNGGQTAHMRIPANSYMVLDGLAIPALTELLGKNAVAGQNYTNLRVQAW